VIETWPYIGTTMRIRVPGTGSMMTVRAEKADERGITVSAEPGYDKIFAPGREVEIEWTEGSAIKVVPGQIAAAVAEEPGKRPRIAIRASDDAERVQRREHVRVQVEVPFTAWTEHDSAKGQQGRTIDLSGSGMLATGNLELWPDDEVEIELELPDEPPIELIAVVARLVKPNAVGFRYTHILPGVRDRLIRYLFKVQQEQLAARAGARPE
jgi:hypothetical protein